MIGAPWNWPIHENFILVVSPPCDSLIALNSLQWFGNIITMEWWDNIWLNEGFASYFEYEGLSYSEPLWEAVSYWLFDRFGYESSWIKPRFASLWPLCEPCVCFGVWVWSVFVQYAACNNKVVRDMVPGLASRGSNDVGRFWICASPLCVFYRIWATFVGCWATSSQLRPTETNQTCSTDFPLAPGLCGACTHQGIMCQVSGWLFECQYVGWVWVVRYVSDVILSY